MNGGNLITLNQNNYETGIDLVKSRNIKKIEFKFDMFDRKKKIYNVDLYDIFEFYLSVVPEILYQAHVNNIEVEIKPYFEVLKKHTNIEQFYILTLNQMKFRMIIHKLFQDGAFKTERDF
jgi:hypothetical protein